MLLYDDMKLLLKLLNEFIIGTKESTSSKLTSSDKLSELPSSPSPPVGYERNATRTFRQGLEGQTSHSLPASLHPSPQLGGNAELAPVVGHSISEGSVGTTRGKVSFGSDRSFPSFNRKQGRLSY